MNNTQSSSKIHKIGLILHTLTSRFLLLFIAILYTIPFIAFHCVNRETLHTSRLFHWLLAQFYRLIVQSSLLTIRYGGKENLKNLEPAVIVVNHQSSMDIPIAGHALQGRHHAWMATMFLKKSLLYRTILPKFVLWVDTSSPVRGMKSLIHAMRHVEKTNQDLIIFPEGSRYIDGKIHDFYSGFAIAAKKLNRPVVPILLQGLHQVYPPNTFWIRTLPVTVLIGKPMKIKNHETIDDFTQRVRQWFLDTNRE